MVTIGIEINHVLRNINKQLLKYYQRDVDNTLDLDEIDEEDDVLNKYIKFDSKAAKSNFIYVDYPYEIFGCADPMSKNVPTHILSWLKDIEDMEDEQYRVVYYSLNEENLTIQSTLFFLSKTTTRIREVFFPESIDEVLEKCDVIITANPDVFTKETDKKIVVIEKEFNKDAAEKTDALKYSSLDELISDKEFFKKIQ